MAAVTICSDFGAQENKSSIALGSMNTLTIFFPGGSVVKNLLFSAVDADWYLDRKDPLEKEMATCSSILAWEIPWTGGLAGYSLWFQRVRHDLAAKLQQFFLSQGVFKWRFAYNLSKRAPYGLTRGWTRGQRGEMGHYSLMLRRERGVRWPESRR